MTDPKNKADAPVEKKADAPVEKKAKESDGRIVPEGKTLYVRRRKFKGGEKVPASLLPSEADIKASKERRALKEKREKVKG